MPFNMTPEQEMAERARLGALSRETLAPVPSEASGALPGDPRRGVIERNGALPFNAAQPGLPTGQATEGYPPASPTQASSQGRAGSAPSFANVQGGNSMFANVEGGASSGALPSFAGVKSGKSTKPVNTTKKMFADADPLAIEDALDTSVSVIENTAKSNPEAFKQVDAALTLKGIDTKEAFFDLRDNIIEDAAKRKSGRASKTYNEKEFKKRWKNIFNLIPEERMGMFLFDFGLRMLAASNTPGGAGGHVGMAGMGALGAMQGQMQLEDQKALEAEKAAGEQAGALIGMEQQERGLGIDSRRADIEEQRRLDESEHHKEQNRLKSRELDIDERKVKLGLSSDGKRNEFSHEAMYNALVAVDYTPRQAMDLINGAPTEAEARLAFSKIFDNEASDGTRGVPPGGTEPKRMRDWTSKERNAYINERVNEITGGSPGGALPRGNGVRPQRPAGWDDYPSK